MTTTLTPPPKLLPFLAGYMDGPEAPEEWRDWNGRDRLLPAFGERLWRLFNSEMAHAVHPVWHDLYPADNRPRACIEATAEWCLNPTQESLNRRNEAAEATAGAAEATAGAAGAAEATAWAAWAAGTAEATAEAAAAAGAAWAAQAAAEAARAAFWRWSYDRFLEMGGVWNPEWNTEAVRGLALTIYQERAWWQMPILADALEEAGCTDLDLLHRLRTSDQFTRADRAIRNPLGIAA